jgi:hypothetical protein
MRMAKVSISIELLMQIMTVGWKADIECIRGIPEGSGFVYSGVDDNTGIAFLVIRHSSFSEVQLGEDVPELPKPTFRRYEAVQSVLPQT